MKNISNKLPRKILFTFWDGGFGHAYRVITVAKEFFDSGYKVGFICSKKYLTHLKALSFINEIFVVENRKKNIHIPPYRFPIYSHAFRHSQRLKGLEFDDVEFLEYLVKQEIAVISKFKPDVIINDYRDTIRISAEMSGVPLIGITKSNGNTAGYTLGWWVSLPDDLILPDCLDSFNFVRNKYKLSPMFDERELFEGDICIIPSSPSIDPLPLKRVIDHYVGVLNEMKSISKPIEGLELKKKCEERLLFWYIGEGNNRPYIDFDNMLCEIVDRLNIYLVVSGSQEKYYKLYEKATKLKRIVIKPFFKPNEYAWILKNASVIVSQGGSTAMLGLAKGIPVIMIPWNAEPNMAYFVNRYGAGIHLQHSLKPLERRPASDLGKNVEIMGHWHSDLNTHRLQEAIETILFNVAYKKKANELSKELSELGNSKTVLQLTQSYFF
jgi:UDP:flavonoid glycosyltransferase YjiC (YdhE family)